MCSISRVNTISQLGNISENNTKFLNNFMELFHFNLEQKGEQKELLGVNNNKKFKIIDEKFLKEIGNVLEEFDKKFDGIVSQQIDTLRAKFFSNGNKICIGTMEEYSVKEIGIDKEGINQKGNIMIIFSKELVEMQMTKHICLMQGNSDNSAEIKTISLKDLIGENEKDKDRLTVKCAAYLLFHELFHINSFANKFFDANDYAQLNGKYSNLRIKSNDNINEEDLKCLFTIKNTIQNEADDARNTLGLYDTEDRVPGEFELLNALTPGTNVIRIYHRNLDFSDIRVKNACCNIFNQIFETNISSDTLTIDQNLSQNQNDSTNWLDVFNCFKFWKLLCAIVIAVNF